MPEVDPTPSSPANPEILRAPFLRVSIAMCTYNGSRYLLDQLRSISSQTILPNELIICDDGSTDNTIPIITEFSKQSRFSVKLFCNEEKLGPAKNFGKAISLCTGDIIVLSDQDDLWIPTKLEKLTRIFIHNPDAIYAFTDAEMVDKNGQNLGRTLWEAVGISNEQNLSQGMHQLQLLLYDNFITGAAMAFRENFRSVILPIPPGWMHDYWIGLLGSTFSHGIPIPEKLLMYRQHATQAVGWGKKTYLQASKASLTAGVDGANRKLEQFHDLLGRIHSVPNVVNCPRERLELLKQKELHLQCRAKIRASTLLVRVARVLREAMTGRYSRFSSSPWSSFFRDLYH